MGDNLLSREIITVPGAVGVLEQRDLVTMAVGTATGGVDAELGLVADDNQACHAECVQLCF